MTQQELIIWVKEQPLKAYQKVGNIQYRISDEAELIDTIIDGVKETSNTANPGDYVITGTKGEQYIIKPNVFNKRYEVLTSEIARPVGKFYGVVYNGTFGDEFEFTASWDENMICNKGDMLGSPDEQISEVYRVEKSAFEKTYEEVK